MFNERFSNILVFSLAIIIFIRLINLQRLLQSKVYIIDIINFIFREWKDKCTAYFRTQNCDKESEFTELIELTNVSYKLLEFAFRRQRTDIQYQTHMIISMFIDQIGFYLMILRQDGLIFMIVVIKGYREYFDQLTSDIGSGIKYGGWFY